MLIVKSPGVHVVHVGVRAAVLMYKYVALPTYTFASGQS